MFTDNKPTCVGNFGFYQKDTIRANIGSSYHLAAQRTLSLPRKLQQHTCRYDAKCVRSFLAYHTPTWERFVPTLWDSVACSLDVDDVNLQALRGPSKALVIASASRYIERLEMRDVQTTAFLKSLKQQINGLQKLVRWDDYLVQQDSQLLPMFAQEDPCAVISR
ncbi:hypothetical protein LTR78_010657 [Recurvomyces mirabilis]|uniref:Uncharacterized protein n=1 Tax=Recurvomyces mirabilis TaxID=574656 RepID=A0AAE0WEZ6_9PEZI|nr:hypothetical protein LTR78_010657 [Recurvomyces mirabilis]KAK5149746.1 hypothetical protein LTS14_010667 [Recurvomyces mirabilis]